MLNEDYKEMLQILLEENVKFIVVGAYALGAHGFPRATGDIDIWIEPTAVNAKKVIRSLPRFRIPLSDVNEKYFIEEGIIFQIGVVPRRIDIITIIDGVEFQSAYAKKLLVSVEGLNIPACQGDSPILSVEDLIKNKESTCQGEQPDRKGKRCPRRQDVEKEIDS